MHRQTSFVVWMGEDLPKPPLACDGTTFLHAADVASVVFMRSQVLWLIHVGRLVHGRARQLHCITPAMPQRSFTMVADEWLLTVMIPSMTQAFFWGGLVCRTNLHAYLPYVCLIDRRYHLVERAVKTAKHLDKRR